jgi:thiol-disulfide isomerase/thioredoxin
MNALESQQQLDNLKHNSEALLVLFGGKNCGVCQTIKPQIDEKFSDK